MLLRPAGATDLAAAAALINAAYRGDTARRGWTHEADLLGGRRTDAATLGAMLAADRGRMLLIGGVPPAVAAMLEPEASGTWHLGMLTVHPDRQAAGLGRELLAAAEGLAAGHGAHAVRIEVISVRVELIGWYERRGYVAVGRSDFPYGDLAVGSPLRDDLEFVVMEKPVRLGRAAPGA